MGAVPLANHLLQLWSEGISTSMKYFRLGGAQWTQENQWASKSTRGDTEIRPKSRVRARDAFPWQNEIQSQLNVLQTVFARYDITMLAPFIIKRRMDEQGSGVNLVMGTLLECEVFQLWTQGVVGTVFLSWKGSNYALAGVRERQGGESHMTRSAALCEWGVRLLLYQLQAYHTFISMITVLVFIF